MLALDCRYCNKPIREHEKYWHGYAGELQVICDKAPRLCIRCKREIQRNGPKACDACFRIATDRMLKRDEGDPFRPIIIIEQ